ncbi:MAG TPA: tetratricopeptide repeat protein [Terriglobia bacterium]|nr:tetratricopeptide repeat protein [Terriglobia bacterium]
MKVMSRMPRLAVALFSGVALWAGMSSAAHGVQAHDVLDRQFQSAVEHYNSGRYQDAARELETLVKSQPASFDVQELLGLVYSAQGKEQAARPHFEKAVQLKPDSGAARANLAVNLSKLGENGPAELQFKRAVALEPHNYEANHDFGEFYVRAGNLRAAIPYLEEAERQDPSAYENGYDLALAYEQTNQMKSAQRLIQQMLERKDTAELHNLLAEADERTGDFVTAANEYERAAHMDPSESNLFDWGSELLLHHTLDPAIQVFSQGVEHYPDSSRLAVGLGLAFFLRGSYDDAVKALLRATDLTPSDARAYYFLSKAYDMAPGQADDVIQHFQRFSQLQPQNARADFYYAMSLWKGKQAQSSGAWVDQVESLLKRAVSLDPSLADAHLQLGNLYSQERKYAEAVPEYQRALALDPNVPDAHYRLGQAYVHLDQKELAQKEFQAHKELYEKHLVKIDEQRTKIRQFIYSMKGEHAGS